MIIRFLTQKDISEHDKVTSQAFTYACDVGDPHSVLPCEKVLGAFDENNQTLFADLEILDRACHYDGGVLTCAAIGGVAAKPEYRGKGAVKALFDFVFRKTDYDISILYPFSEEYYRKLGYERTGYSLQVTVPFSAISKIKRNNDVTLYEGNNTEQLLSLYNRCARKYNLSFVRTSPELFSVQPYLSQKYTYIWKSNALACIQIDREKSTVFVEEIYFDSCESMLGILGFLRNFESNQNHICFQNIPEGSPLLHFIQDFKKCEIRLRNTGSARILNFERVLKAHRYPSGSGEFVVRIEKDVFKVSFSDGSVKVEKNDSYVPDAVMDVSAASKLLLCGFRDAEYIPGLVIFNPESRFLDSFPPRTAFYTDPF